MCKSCATHHALIICNVVCHVEQRNSSAVKSDRNEITFILAVFHWLKLLPDEGGRKSKYLEKTPITTSDTPPLPITTSETPNHNFRNPPITASEKPHHNFRNPQSQLQKTPSSQLQNPSPPPPPPLSQLKKTPPPITTSENPPAQLQKTPSQFQKPPPSQPQNPPPPPFFLPISQLQKTSHHNFKNPPSQLRKTPVTISENPLMMSSHERLKISSPSRDLNLHTSMCGRCLHHTSTPPPPPPLPRWF